MTKFLALLLNTALCAFLLFLLSSTSRAAVTLDRIEASVNSQLILMSDLSKFRENLGLRSQLDPLFSGTSLSAAGQKAADPEIVQFLIDEKVVSQTFPVTDAEVEQEINSIMANNHITRETLKETLKAQGFAYEDYFDLIRSSASKRNLIDRDIRTKVTISDDDVKNYFYNHYSTKTSAPKNYKIKLIHVSSENYRDPKDARAVVERALQQIRSGEPFEQVAIAVSDDPSAKTGGDFGTFSEDQMAPLIRDQLKGLQVGQVSSVFGTPRSGFFIIKLADVESGENQHYEKVKDEIRQQLTASEYTRQIQLWLERQRQSSFIHRAGESALQGLPIVR